MAPPGRPTRAAVGQACRKQNCPPGGFLFGSNLTVSLQAVLVCRLGQLPKTRQTFAPRQLYRLLPHPVLGTGHRATRRPTRPRAQKRAGDPGDRPGHPELGKGHPFTRRGPAAPVPASATLSLPSPRSSLCRTHRQAPATLGTWWPSASRSPRTNPLAPIPLTPLRADPSPGAQTSSMHTRPEPLQGSPFMHAGSSPRSGQRLLPPRPCPAQPQDPLLPQSRNPCAPC